MFLSSSVLFPITARGFFAQETINYASAGGRVTHSACATEKGARDNARHPEVFAWRKVP